MFNGYIPIWLIFHDCPSSFDRFFSTCQFPICKLVDPNNFLPVGIRFVPKKNKRPSRFHGFLARFLRFFGRDWDWDLFSFLTRVVLVLRGV